MLVGVDASRAVAGQRTGTENYSLGLIRALLERGRHRYRLYAREALPPELAGLGAEPRVMAARRLWTHTRLAAEVLRRRPDVLFVPAHVLPLTHPPASVVTVHDLGFRFFPAAHPLRQRVYLDLTTRWAVRRAAHLLADSEATRQDVARLYDADPARVTVVYPGVDAQFSPHAEAGEAERLRAVYGVAAPYVLHVGTLQPRKNLGVLVEALAQLRARLPELSLVLAGRPGWGGEAERLRALVARLGLEGRVRFLGHAAPADLPALMRTAAVVTMPSLFEGFGMPLAEAMACGTPTVAADTSCLPEVVGDAGLLALPRDFDRWAGQIGRAVEDGALRETLRARGVARAARYTWAAAAERAEEALGMAWEARKGAR